MRGIKLVPLCFGSLSVIAFALAVQSAAAQEVHGHILCRAVGAFAPEQLGDREGHALSIGQSSCQVTEGPVADAVQTETNMWEWDGPKATELSGYDRWKTERLDSLRAWHRNSGDRKLGVFERQEVRVDRQGHRSECL
jgi:hypothetical protein